MIDIASRRRLLEENKNRNMMEATKNAIKDGFASKGAEDTLKMVFEKKDDQEVKSLLEKIAEALPLINKAIPRSFTLPKVFQIRGNVQVENDIKVRNLNDLEKYFQDLSTQVKMLAQAISSVPQQKIEFPKLEIPKAQEIDFTPISEAIQNLQEALNKGSMDKDTIPVLRKIEKSISELANRPVMTPQPVTNVTLNGLQGNIKTTSATVGSTVAQLPSYGQLFNRRAIVIYNNSAVTIYIGGSDVTTSNGMPVPANSYSPILDAGYNMVMYGIAASGSNNVRVLEVSKDKSDTIQQ